MFKKIVYMLFILIMAYLALCYVDILVHNLSGGSNTSWNFMVKLLTE